MHNACYFYPQEAIGMVHIKCYMYKWIMQDLGERCWILFVVQSNTLFSEACRMLKLDMLLFFPSFPIHREVHSGKGWDLCCSASPGQPREETVPHHQQPLQLCVSFHLRMKTQGHVGLNDVLIGWWIDHSYDGSWKRMSHSPNVNDLFSWLPNMIDRGSTNTDVSFSQKTIDEWEEWAEALTVSLHSIFWWMEWATPLLLSL